MVSFPPHGVRKIRNFYLKAGCFTILYKLASLATLGLYPACQHLSVPPADKAEAATGPQLHSIGSVLPAWPRRPLSLWAPLLDISHSPRDGEDGNLKMIWPGPRISLVETVSSPHKISGDNVSTGERKILPEFSRCAWFPTPSETWTQTTHLMTLPVRHTHWCLWRGSGWPRNSDFRRGMIFKHPVPSIVPGTRGYKKNLF